MFPRIAKATSLVQYTCTFARWYSRRPTAIVNADELSIDPKCVDTISSSRRRRGRPKRIKAQKENAVEITKTTNVVETVAKRFKVLSPEDKTLSSMMVQVKSRKRREKNELILLEGKNLIREGLMSNVEPVAIFFNHTRLIDDLELPDTAKLYKTTYNSIQLWSNLTTSPGIIGVFKTPDLSNKKPSDDSIPLTLILDNVREPGNLGSILRSAAGIGCERFIIIRKGCVDLWEPKVLRSACGAHFRLPIYNLSSWEEIPEILSDSCAMYIADSNPGVKEHPLKKGFPTLSSLPIRPWYEINYTTQEVALVVTGETGQLSSDATNILQSEGIRVHIPLCNEVDSLNAAVAISVIGFEIRRQFMAKRGNELNNEILEE